MNRNVKRFAESTKLRAKNVLTCQRVLRAWEKSYIGIEFIPILVLLFLFLPVLIQPH